MHIRDSASFGPDTGGPKREPPHTPHGSGRWLDLWTTSLFPAPLPDHLMSFLSGAHTLRNTTIRQTVRLPLRSRAVRIGISNYYGQSSLGITRATIARPGPGPNQESAGSPSILPETLQELAFSRSKSFEIPPGATVYSDPLFYELPASCDLSISLYIAGGQAGEIITAHQMAKSTGWLTQGHGDCTSDKTIDGTKTTWSFFLSTVSGLVDDPSSWALACLGDSLTDCGDGDLPLNTYSLWPDILQARLLDRSSTPEISVLNFGISGDRLFEGGLPRLEREVLGRMGHGIRKVFVFMGVNDIGMAPATAQGQQVVYQRLTQAYRQITTCCHSSTPKLEVAISTITPFMPPSDNYPTPWPFAHPLRENTRLKVNDWIRRHQKSDETTDGFDYLIDWAKVVCESDEGSRIQAKYQLSDYLHLSFEGCRAMAEAVDLDIFAGAARKCDS